MNHSERKTFATGTLSSTAIIQQASKARDDDGVQQFRDAVRESQAILAAMLSAQAHIDRGVEGYRAAAEGFQHAAEEFRQGTQEYRSAIQHAHAAVDLLSGVVDGYSDTITQHITPGHPGALDL